MKKRIALILASAMLVSSAVCSLASCTGSGDANKGAGHVYYLNFKPEIDEQWKALAAKYTEETGIQVDVTTAADGTYEQTLASELAKTDAPTLFRVGGVNDLNNWKDYCYDLTGSAFANELTDQNYAIKDSDGKIREVAYCIETFGIITNKKLLEQAGHSVDEITNFETLKAVVEDIHARSAELGFDAFAVPAMDSSSDWRFKTHLANLPIAYEYKKDGISNTDALKGTYLDNYRQIWDLYINNSSTDPALLASKTMDDSRAEFVDGKAVFYQNGGWEYGSVSVLGDENVTMIPIYIGVEGEENQGLCVGTENFWAVNSQAAEEDIQATLDFLEWVVTSDAGTDALANEMNLLSPFKKAKEAPNMFDKLAAQMVASGKTSVNWEFTSMPSESWKDDVGSALTAYAAKQNDDTWAKVKEAFVDGWAKEKAAAAQ